MKEIIEKLIAEYQVRINFLNSGLKKIKNAIEEAKNKDDVSMFDYSIGEKQRIEGKLSHYLQFKTDLESLLDHI